VIDSELQAQGWALFPDLAEDLNKIRIQRPSSEADGGRPAINPLATSADEKPEDATAEDKEKRSLEDVEIEGHLLHPRIPTRQKGKVVQGNEGIQDGHDTTSAAQATSSTTMAKTALKDTTAPLSTRLQQ